MVKLLDINRQKAIFEQYTVFDIDIVSFPFVKWMKLLERIPNIEIAYISELQSKFHSNDNLNKESIFEIANRIFKKYNLEPISQKNFIENKINLVDDLPF